MERLQVNFDRLKKANWTPQETQNARLVAHFIQHLMNNHDFDYILDTYGSDPYKQHNQSMVDGVEGVLDFVSGFAKRYPEYTYDVKHLYVDGDFVTAHSHVTSKAKHRGNPKKGFNIMDTWRIEDGKMVEHWDAIQPIHGSMRLLFLLIGGRFKNTNTFF